MIESGTSVVMNGIIQESLAELDSGMEGEIISIFHIFGAVDQLALRILVIIKNVQD